MMIQEIDDYEAKTIGVIQIDKKAKEAFERKILLGEFSKKWRSYLKKVKIDDEEVAKTNELAVTLRKEGDRCKKQLDSLISF